VIVYFDMETGACTPPADMVHSKWAWEGCVLSLSDLLRHMARRSGVNQQRAVGAVDRPTSANVHPFNVQGLVASVAVPKGQRLNLAEQLDECNVC
jgi:hypothetical protein